MAGKWKWLLLVFLIVITEGSEVIVLSDESFDYLTTEGEWLLYFYQSK